MRLALLLALLPPPAAAVANVDDGAGETSPTPGQAPNLEAPAAPQAPCARCHEREAAEWRASLHRASFTDLDFQSSFATEPMDFCFRCHAPLAKDRPDTASAALGVGCLSCHTVARGHIEGSTTEATTTGCGGCHEFTFPHQAELMQSTMTEHARSPFAARACSSCHMPRAADGHKDHRFDVSRNAALLRASIDVKARRTARGVAIDLATRNVGHAMPTGDLFRRLLVVVRAEDEHGRPLGADEVVLGRRFERSLRYTREREDTRIEGARSLLLEGDWLRAARRIEVVVRYERVAETADVRDAEGGYQRHDRLFAATTLAELMLDR